MFGLELRNHTLQGVRFKMVHSSSLWALKGLASWVGAQKATGSMVRAERVAWGPKSSGLEACDMIVRCITSCGSLVSIWAWVVPRHAKTLRGESGVLMPPAQLTAPRCREN